MPEIRPGRVVIISSPSGGGKTTICKALLNDERTSQGWSFSVSYTTRKKRANEENGREYFFVTSDEFEAKVSEGFFAEHFSVHGNKYGTPKQPLEDVVESGGVKILDIDIQGARRIKEKFPKATAIFILPPSLEELRRRLEKRATETSEELELRYEGARGEIESILHSAHFGYFVINEELNEAVLQVLAIIEADKHRIENLPSEQLHKLIG